MSVITAIGDGVAAAINAANESSSLTPPLPGAVARKWLPGYSLPELAALQVTVALKSESARRISRTSRQIDYQIDIGVQQSVGTPPNAALTDSLSSLVEQLADLLFATPLAVTGYGGPPLVAVEIQNEPVYDLKMLHEQGVFISVLTATYRVGR